MIIKIFLIKNKKRIKNNIIKVFSVFLLLSSCESAFATEDLVFNVTGQPPLNTVKNDGFMDEIVREALKRIGYNLIINRLPAERGLRSLNQGLIDGEMSRVKGIDKSYTNLLRVPEKIMSWDFVVFSKKGIELSQGWASLENKNVAFINGWKIVEKNIPDSSYITKTKNSKQLFTLLKKNRTDFIIYEHWGGHYVINMMGMKKVKIRQPALASKDMYIYIHKKHENLLPVLSKALSTMKKDGSYKKIFNKHLKSDKRVH